jgi:hypothetical protein
MREEDALRKKSMEHHSRKQVQQARKKRFAYLVKKSRGKQTDKKRPERTLCGYCKAFSPMKP